MTLTTTTLHRSASCPSRYAVVYLFLTLTGASAHPTQPISFQPMNRQDTLLQALVSILLACICIDLQRMLHQPIPSPELEGELKDVSTSSDGISASGDDDIPFHREPNFIPPINVETPVARSPTNPCKPSPSVTPPLTPGHLSSSQLAYASSPSQLAVSPPTLADFLDGLRLDDYPPSFTHSAPVSPYLTQRPPRHTSHPLRVLSIRSHLSP